MTKRMQQVIQRLEALPEEEQDSVAASVGLMLDDDDEKWEQTTARHAGTLKSLLADITAAERRGELETLDPETL